MMMPATIHLRMTARKISPMVMGLLKPVVILPVSVLSGLNPEQVEAILIHEPAHIRRYDHVVMIIQSIATQVLFFHPLAWYLSAELDRERENCCDDLVMKIFPNPINYIKALTMIQELHLSGPIPANALLGRTKSLLGRISRILKPEMNQTPVYRIAMVFMLLITLGIAVVTLATTGNSGNKKSMVLVFSEKAEKPIAIPDTSKIKAEKKVLKQDESLIQEEKKKEKDIEDARRELEKAEQELEKAREEMMRNMRQFREEDWEKFREDWQHAPGCCPPILPDIPHIDLRKLHDLEMESPEEK
jgi:hypothetical protein